jgi:tRNA pseudouridine13 synthase
MGHSVLPWERPVDSTCPYLTADIPPIPARIKQRDGDFVVEEVPLYLPCGDGDHAYVLIEKVGLTTRHAVLEIARALGVPPSAIGVAGQKDARGITRQAITVQGVDPARVRLLTLPRITILGVTRHRTKLRPGSLRANRFFVRLRQVPAERTGDVQSLLDVLARRGVPNYFGPQRFGMRGDTWEVGRSLLRGDFDHVVALMVGQPTEKDAVVIRRAREHAAEGRFAEAARAWPDGFRDCARLCRLLAQMGGDTQRAIFGLDHRVLGFYVSAFQAWLFNRVLAERVTTLDRIFVGDLFFTHATGRIVRAEDREVEQSRVTHFEVSPTGPIAGYTMEIPQGEPAAIEQRVFDEAGVSLRDLPRTGPLTCVGGRRPLRFRAEEICLDSGTDEAGEYAELRFTLPAGCYATSLLREVCKDRLGDGRLTPNGTES